MGLNVAIHSDLTTTRKIGLGGGCHWCTEGVFSSLNGIKQVKQGWIASSGDNSAYSEAIEVYFEPDVISLADLIEIHLHTHASTANHCMRGKYRSAIYSYDDSQFKQATKIVNWLKADFTAELITQVYPFKSFKENKTELQNYFYTNPDRPFCHTYIQPKIRLLLARFKANVNQNKVAAIIVKTNQT
jgi:peptide-methionine (S)-S-oxide reductase